MFRHADDLPERPDPPDPEPSAHRTRRRFTPVPLAIVAAVLALWAEFFGMFLLGWGMAPTSVGCGTGRALSMTGAMVPIALGIYVAFTWAGLGLMGDAGETQRRRRSFLGIFTIAFVVGSAAIFAMAALLGSCFDF